MSSPHSRGFLQHAPLPTARRALLCAPLVLALVMGGSTFLGAGVTSAHLAGSTVAPAANASSNPDDLCSSGGTMFLGIEWNCVTWLNFTVVMIMLGGIGIIAYVFRDSDSAELPGDSATVPLTEQEWEDELARRRVRRASVQEVTTGPEDLR